MTDKYNLIIFSVLEYGDFDALTVVIKKIKEELVVSGKAKFDTNARGGGGGGGAGGGRGAGRGWGCRASSTRALP